MAVLVAARQCWQRHDSVGNGSDEDNDYLPNFQTRPGIVRLRLKVVTFLMRIKLMVII